MVSICPGLDNLDQRGLLDRLVGHWILLTAPLPRPNAAILAIDQNSRSLMKKIFNIILYESKDNVKKEITAPSTAGIAAQRQLGGQWLVVPPYPLGRPRRTRLGQPTPGARRIRSHPDGGRNTCSNWALSVNKSFPA